MIQNHIHLSKVIGDAPENAPDMKWIIIQEGWQPSHEIIATVNKSLTGKLKVHRLKNNSGDVIRLKNIRYVIKINDYLGYTFEERHDALVSMLGERVYLVEEDHPQNGSDHTDYVRSMYLSAITDVKPISPMVKPLYFSVELMDDSI